MPTRGLLDAPIADPAAEWMLPAVSLPDGRVVLHTAAAEPDFFHAETFPGSGPIARRVELHLDRPVRFVTTATSRGLRGDTSWVGVPEDDPTGLAVLTATPTGMVGAVHTHGAWFEIEEPLPGYQQVVAALDVSPAGDGCLATAAADSPPPAADDGAPPAAAPAEVPLAAGESPEVVFPVIPCGYDPDDDIDLLVVVSDGAWQEMNQPADRQMWALVQNRVDWGNAALVGSNLDVRFRLVGVVRADVGSMSPGALGDRLNVNQILACLRDPALPECPAASATIDPLRDAYGADIVSVVTDMITAAEPQDTACPDRDGPDTDTLPDLGDDSDADTDAEPACDHDDNVGVPSVGGLACTECPPFGIGPLFSMPVPTAGGTCFYAPGEDDAWTVAAWENGWNTMVHELGHKLGAGHGAWQADSNGAFGDNYAYVAPDCSFQTIMGGGQPCGPTVDVDDIPFFSGSCVQAGAAGTNGMSQPIGDDANENVRVMALAAPYLSAYRDTVVADWTTTLGRVTSPADGTNVPAGAVTFSVSSAALLRVVEIGVAPGDATDIHVLQAGDGVLTATPPVIWPAPFTVRVWTEVPVPSAPGGVVWDYVDHRYNYAGVVRGCDSLFTTERTALAGVVPSDFVASMCSVEQQVGPRRDVCTYNSAASSMDCALGGLAPNTGEYWAESTSKRHDSSTYDYVVWGTAQQWTVDFFPGIDMWAPQAFCCALKETPTAQLHELSITGTPKTDRIRLRQCTSEYLSPVSPPLSVTIIGASGDDLLFGSDDISTAYQEELRGGIGSDRIYAGDGDDTLIGNEGDDFLFGGNGNDFLFGNGNNDELHGGAGSDNLQGGNNDDILQGDAGFDDLRGGSGADLLCDAFDADDLRGQDGNDRLFYLPVIPGPTLAIPDPPGIGTDTCSNMPGFPSIWPTCEVQVLFTDPAFNDCPEWSP